MDGELVRQAELLFGGRIARRLQERASEGGTSPAVPRANPDGAKDATSEPVPPVESVAVPPIVKLQMTSRQERRLWRHVEAIDNFWETLTEIEPGAVARLAAVATERKWEVLFLTKRPASAGATAQLQTQRWLEAKGFVPAERVRRSGVSRPHCRRSGTRLRDRRSAGELPRYRGRFEGAGRTRVARRREAAADCGPPPWNRGREVSG